MSCLKWIGNNLFFSSLKRIDYIYINLRINYRIDSCIIRINSCIITKHSIHMYIPQINRIFSVHKLALVMKLRLRRKICYVSIMFKSKPSHFLRD